jgi:hypothetical protein
MKGELLKGPFFSIEVDQPSRSTNLAKTTKSTKHSFKNKIFLKNQLEICEKSKMQRYFAIAEFNNKITADFVLTACDGLAYKTQSNVLDLRFVPQSMSFDQLKAVDTAFYTPHLYTKPTISVKDDINWEKSVIKRKNILQWEAKEKEIEIIGSNSYIASESDNDRVEHVELIRERYKKLMAGSKKYSKQSEKINAKAKSYPV